MIRLDVEEIALVRSLSDLRNCQREPPRLFAPREEDGAIYPEDIFASGLDELIPS